MTISGYLLVNHFALKTLNIPFYIILYSIEIIDLCFTKVIFNSIVNICVTKNRWIHQMIRYSHLGILNHFLQSGCKICRIPVTCNYWLFGINRKEIMSRNGFVSPKKFCLKNSGSNDTINYHQLRVTSGYFETARQK